MGRSQVKNNAFSLSIGCHCVRSYARQDPIEVRPLVEYWPLSKVERGPRRVRQESQKAATLALISVKEIPFMLKTVLVPTRVPHPCPAYTSIQPFQRKQWSAQCAMSHSTRVKPARRRVNTCFIPSVSKNGTNRTPRALCAGRSRHPLAPNMPSV